MLIQLVLVFLKALIDPPQVLLVRRFYGATYGAVTRKKRAVTPFPSCV